MIFDKVLEHEIDKAIILRDGKPCFLLMEFQKYEKIMAEYEQLKEYVNTLEKSPKKKEFKKPKKRKVEKETISEEIEEPEEELKINLPIQNITPEDKAKIDQKNEQTQEEKSLTEEQELKEAMQSIESMNFDDEMKQEAQKKIHTRIVQARKERAKILADEKQHQEDLKEELILQSQLKEKKKKKDRELREFWD
ncbi:hypothetical protein ADUPG1_006297 [Aduncisulcus paluster]|uniref:Uncharacterized protein n=1 Tax=Aduncisulcus paluster TaxID=2918883 RepID=A0ABQ5KHP1_9EUKA|nr:hypothetical protein ADUPG1_006297 [Aduncisulcus paluster]